MTFEKTKVLALVHSNAGMLPSEQPITAAAYVEAHESTDRRGIMEQMREIRPFHVRCLMACKGIREHGAEFLQHFGEMHEHLLACRSVQMEFRRTRRRMVGRKNRYRAVREWIIRSWGFGSTFRFDSCIRASLYSFHSTNGKNIHENGRNVLERRRSASPSAKTVYAGGFHTISNRYARLSHQGMDADCGRMHPGTVRRVRLRAALDRLNLLRDKESGCFPFPGNEMTPLRIHAGEPGKHGMDHSWRTGED